MKEDKIQRKPDFERKENKENKEIARKIPVENRLNIMKLRKFYINYKPAL